MSKYWESVLDVIPDFICILSITGKIVKVNKALRDHIKLPEGKILGRECRDIIGCEYCNTSSCMLQLALNKQTVVMELLNSNFKVPVLATASVIIDEKRIDNSVFSTPDVLGIVITAKDISELKEKERTIELSERKYKTLVETASEGIASTDTDGVFIFANSALSDITGFSNEEIIGTKAHDFVDFENAKVVENARIKRISGQAGTYELSMIAKNGKKLNLLVSSVPIMKDNKHIENIIFLTDLTEIRNDKEQLKVLKAATKRLRIGELLIRRSLLSFSQLSEGLEYLDREQLELGQILISKGFISKNDLALVLTDQTNGSDCG